MVEPSGSSQAIPVCHSMALSSSMRCVSGDFASMIHVPGASLTPNTGQQSSGPSGVSSRHPNTGTTLGKTLTFTNPFANPAELESLKRSFAQQPNWKAAQLESVSWEGTTDENIRKYRGLMAAVE